MKKIYLSILSLAVLATANAQEKTSLMTRSGNMLQEATMINQIPMEKATVLWSDDFSSMANWTVVNTGTGTNATTGWYQETNPAAIPVSTISPFASTTASNGFIMVNSDANNTSGANSPVTGSRIHSEVTSSTIDLTGNASVVLRFQQNFRWWHDTRTVSVSGDNGVTWTDYLISDDAAYDIGIYTGNQSSLNPDQVVIDISAVAGNSNQVQIKFTYDDNDWWGWYWAIDDVEIIQKPNDDIQMLSAFIVDQGNEGVEYGRTPVDQVGANWEIGAQIYNFGVNDATNVSVTCVEAGGNFNLTATDPLIQSDSTKTVSVQQPLTLGVGTYVVDYTATSDGEQSGGADFGDNTGQRTMEVTNWEYSIDGIGVYPAGGVISALGTASFQNAADNLIIASKYHFNNPATIYSIKALITSTTVAGAEVFAQIIDTADMLAGSINPIAITNSYVVTAQDVTNGFIEIPFDLTSQPSLAAGSYYAAVELISNGNSTDISILNDERVAQPSLGSMIYIPNDQSYINGVASAVRMMIQDPATIGLGENTLEGVSVYPNPSEGVITVSNANNAENTIVVYDMVGKVVYSTSANTSTTIDLSSNGTGVYMVKVSNENGSIVERVVIK